MRASPEVPVLAGQHPDRRRERRESPENGNIFNRKGRLWSISPLRGHRFMMATREDNIEMDQEFQHDGG
ncbi:MAG: hypothetical protein BGN84_09670 [Afipia sp. 62-7]|nr:MAG: hypothetical protein BGN84_09670 [Afipia sp. 62-7]